MADYGNDEDQQSGVAALPRVRRDVAQNPIIPSAPNNAEPAQRLQVPNPVNIPEAGETLTPPREPPQSTPPPPEAPPVPFKPKRGEKAAWRDPGTGRALNIGESGGVWGTETDVSNKRRQQQYVDKTQSRTDKYNQQLGDRWQNYNDALDRYTSRVAGANAKSERTAENADVTDTFRQSRVLTERDENGNIVPQRDADGNVVYRTGKGPVQYDAQGHAVQTEWTPTGPKTTHPDENADIGTHPDQPNMLFRQNKKSPWDYLGTVQEGLASKDENVKSAAQAAQLKLDKRLHADVGNTLGQNLSEVTQDIRGKTATLKNLQSQLGQITDDQLNQKTGGIFGVGGSLTTEAQAARTQKADLEVKITDLQSQGYSTGKILPGTPLSDRLKGAQSAAAEWRQASPKELGDLDNAVKARESSLVENGIDPGTDPALKALNERKAQLGIGQPTSKSAPEDNALRQDPVYGPLLQQRDALDEQHKAVADHLNQISDHYDTKLAPARQEIDAGLAQIAPQEKVAGRLMGRLEQILGMEPAQEGEDFSVRQDEVSRRLAQLQDTGDKARAQTLLNRLEPMLSEISQRKAELQPLMDAHDAIANERNTTIQSEFDKSEAQLGPQREDLANRWGAEDQIRRGQQITATQNWVTDLINGKTETPPLGSYVASPDGQVHSVAQEAINAQSIQARKKLESWDFEPGDFERELLGAPFKMAGEGLKGFARLSEGFLKLFPNQPEPRAYATRALADLLLKVPGVLSTPESEKSLAGKAGGFIGDVVGAVGAGIADPAILVPLFFGQGVNGQMEAAEKSGADKNTALKAGVLGGTINALLAIPFEGFGKSLTEVFGSTKQSAIATALKESYERGGAEAVANDLNILRNSMLKTASASAFKKTAVDALEPVIKEITKTTLQRAGTVAARTAENAAVFGGVQAAQNLITKTYNPDTGLFENVLPAAGEGAVLGAFFGGLHQAVRANKAAAAKEEISVGMAKQAKAQEAKPLGIERQLPETGEQQPSAPESPATGAIPTVDQAHEEINNLQMEGKTPEEHAVTQDALRGMVKISQGEPMAALTATEKRAVLAKDENGIARVEVAKGKPVITQAALDRVSQIAPVTSQILPKSEEEQRQHALKPETQPTFAVEVEGPKGEREIRQVQASTEQAAQSQVAGTIQPGKGMVRDVTRLPGPTEAVAPKDFIESAVASARDDKGSDLTPDEDKQLRVVAKVIQPHYERWQKAFQGIGFTLNAIRSGGAMSSGQNLTISIPDVMNHAAEYAKSPGHAGNIMVEEVTHAVTTALEDRDPETGVVRGKIDLVKIYQSLPQKIQDAMRKFYKAEGSNDYHFAHEMWARWLAGDMELQAGRKIKLKGKFLPEQSSRQFIVENRKALATLLRFFRDMQGTLRKNGATEDLIQQVVQAQELIRGKVKEVDAHAQTPSKVSGRENEPKNAVPSEPVARGPPLGGAESTGATTSGGRSRSAGEIERSEIGNRSTAKAVTGTLEPGAREQLGNVSVGHQSRVTQNGRTFDVTYVAQPAEASKPSHNELGVPTRGYPQELQPRDRSLPQYRRQSQNIAQNLDFEKSAFFPETKTPATTPDIGAPIMTQGGHTLVGNGREIGILQAYKQNSPSARKYKADFVRNAAAFGLNPDEVRAMKNPVLKRVISGNPTTDELIRFSQESNEGVSMGQNATEIANRDASRLTPELLSDFDPNYALDAGKNKGFLQNYLRDVVKTGDANESNINQADLARRVRAAVFTYAYGADAEGRAALDRLATEEGGGKVITNALLTVAPIMARLRADIASGDLHSGFDISPAITRSAQDIAEAIKNKPASQATSTALAGLLGQGRLFENQPIEKSVLSFLVEHRTKRTDIEEALSNYVEGVYRLGNPKQAELLQRENGLSPLEVWKRATTPEAIAPKTDQRSLLAQELRQSLKAQPLHVTGDQVYAGAERVRPEYEKTIREIVQQVGGRYDPAPLKKRERAEAKVSADYGGDWSRIKDVIRGTIWVHDLTEGMRVTKALEQRFGAPKRDLTKPLPTGYRDSLFNPVIDGHTTEVQVNLETLAQPKKIAHDYYERQQSIERSAKLEGRDLNSQELRTLSRLVAAQRRIYQAGLPPGISSAQSEGLQPWAESSSALEAGRGVAEPSKIQGVPSLLTTRANAPSGALESGTSRNVLPFGKSAVASSSVIAPSYTANLSSQQLDLFGNYVDTLPAAAKVSKPAMKREVQKDIPEFADNQDALDALMELAKPSRPRRNKESEALREASGELSKWIEQELQAGKTISSSDLFTAADTAFGGTQGQSIYTPKDAYDAAEVAINRIISKTPEFSPQTHDPIGAIRALKEITSQLPTQTKRTSETDEFQQFSTVPPLAFVTNWVANIKASDVVLEPSAGVGGLIAFAKNAGAKVVANELSPRRADLLKQSGLADQVFTENGEQIHNVLPDSIQPNVVTTNPPFSSTAGRMQGTRETTNAARHIEQDLLRLEPGGRFVAIVGNGMAPDRPTFKAWWNKIGEQYAVRANIGVSGAEYAKYGTTWDNQLVVIDKVPKNSVKTEPVYGNVGKIEDLIPLLKGVKNDRPESVGSLTGERRPVTRSPEQAIGATNTGIPKGTDVAGSGAVPATEQSGVVGSDQGGERPVGSRETGIGLGERQGASGNGVGGDVRSGTGPLPEPNGLERTEVTHAEAKSSGELTDAVFDNYQPRIVVPGAAMPPVEVQESSAMAAVDPITPTYRPAIPKEVYTPPEGKNEGRISSLAMESVVLAGNSHQDMIPLAYTAAERDEYMRNHGVEPPTEARRGFFIGDGTGMGKGRQVMGVILDNWIQGRRKAVWISEKPGLIHDAKRDADDVAYMGNKIFDVAKTKLADDIPHPNGIAFVSYSTLRSVEKQSEPGQKAKSRLEQLVKWFGEDFDGVVAFDESHNMANNVTTKGKRGMTKPSAQALAGLQLQRRLPKARILYLSATGATEVSNLGYGERLGLWGSGTPFGDKNDFIEKVGSGGVAAMELVARDMKALGSYVARAISWKGVTYDNLEHNLSPEQREIYDVLAEAWQGVLREMDAALEVIGAVGMDPKTGQQKTDSGAKSAARSAFWSAHQRFFNQIITSMKMPTVLKASEQHLADGKSVVMQLVNTNEATQNRQIAKKRAEAAESGEEADLEDLDMTPRDQLMQMVERSFPVTQREMYTDEDGNTQFRIAQDSNGNPVINREAVKMRDALLDKLGSIRVPDGPLEMAMNHFGPDQVAEVTGRTQRVVWGKDQQRNRTKVVERRSPLARIKEAKEFQNGKRRLLIFSNAGGTGMSFHADLREKNQEKRVHILIQPGWQATRAVQGFGRTHRNNQKQPPHYQLAASDVVGEKRFMSSIARRLDQLGALTKGQRQAASQGFFKSRDNLESEEAKAALKWFYRDSMRGAIPNLTPDLLEKEMGLKMRDKEGNLLAETPPITQFLNRLLSLKLDTQNTVFDAFSDRLDRVVEQAISAGTLDQGMENLTALNTKSVEDKPIYTEPRTGAQTRYVKLELTQPNDRASFPETGREFYKNARSGKIYAAGRAQTMTETDTGRIVDQVFMRGITRNQWVNKNELQNSDRWEAVSPNGARSVWEEEHDKTPETRNETVHFITGTILPVWDRVQVGRDRTMQVKRVQTDDGKRMIGMVVRPSEIAQVLQNFGATEGVANVEVPDAIRQIMQDGAQARLSNGWRIKRSRVSGENRLELIGPDYANQAELETAGVFSERIQYQTRYFIPTGMQGERALRQLVVTRPITELTGGDQATDRLASQALTQEKEAQSGTLRSQPVATADRYREGLPLAMKIANSFYVPGMDREDIEQHARIALARAAEAYDPARANNGFRPLAATAVRNELKSLRELGARQKRIQGAISLNSPVEGRGETTQDLLQGASDVRREVALDEGRRVLNDSIDKLPERMRNALDGLLSGRPLREIGDDMGVSPEGARKLALKAMERVRSSLKEIGVSRTSDLLSQQLDVLDAGMKDSLRAQASADPLGQLMASLDTDELEKLFDKASAEERGHYTVGRPDLAMGASEASQRAVDQYYNDLWNPKTRDTMQRDADKILKDAGVTGFANEIAARWLRGDTLRDSEVMAAKQVLSELSHDFTPEGLKRMFATGFAYRNIRGQTARDLAAGFDPHKTPEERNREFLTKIISTLPPEKEAEIAREPDAGRKREMLDAATKERLDQLEKAFSYISKNGVTLEDILGGGWELHGKGKEFLENQRQTWDVPHQKALKLAIGGERAPKDIAKATGLSEKEVRDTIDQFNDQVEKDLVAKVKSGLRYGNMSFEGMLSSQATEGLRAQTISDADALSEARKIMRGMGLVAAKDLGNFKVAKRKRPKIFVPPKSARTETPEDIARRESAPVPYPEGQKPPYTGRVLGQPGLPLYQEMMVRKGADLGNVDDVAKIARVAQAANGNKADMIFEAWMASILSGPTTHIAYKMALAGNAGFEFGIQRGVESLVNLLYREQDAPTFGEFKYVLRGLLPGVVKGISLGARQWNTETQLFDHEVLNSQVEAFPEMPGTGFQRQPAISEAPLQQFFGSTAQPVEAQLQKLGKLNPVRGRVVRMPFRALYFIDGFYKMTNAQMAVAGYAYRMAKREGLEGDMLSRRINELIATPGSPAWIKAADVADWLTFRSRIKTKEQGGNWIDNAVATIANARNKSHVIGSQIPFIQLPYNIVKTGFQKAFSPVTTPYKFAKAGIQALPHPEYDPGEGAFKMKDGKPFFENYSKADQIRDISTSLIALGAMGLLWQIVAGDGDDDKKQVLLTGSTPYSQLKRGVRELEQRAYGGPYVLRIGGRGGAHINFGKYEPFATVLGTLADTIIQLKHIVRGEANPKEALDALSGYFIAQAQEKTFLRGFDNLSKVMSGEMSVTELPVEMVLNGLVPALIRQPLRNLDDYMPNWKQSGGAYRLLPAAALRQPKIDIYGKPVEKTGNWFSRMFTMPTAKPYSELENADKLLLNWNARNPRDARAPSPPSTTYQDIHGKTQQMTPAESTKFQVTTGKRFDQYLTGRFTAQQIQHPTEEDVKTIENLHRQAVDDTKKEMFSKLEKAFKSSGNRNKYTIRKWAA